MRFITLYCSILLTIASYHPIPLSTSYHSIPLLNTNRRILSLPTSSYHSTLLRFTTPTATYHSPSLPITPRRDLPLILPLSTNCHTLPTAAYYSIVLYITDYRILSLPALSTSLTTTSHYSPQISFTAQRFLSLSTAFCHTSRRPITTRRVLSLPTSVYHSSLLPIHAHGILSLPTAIYKSIASYHSLLLSNTDQRVLSLPTAPYLCPAPPTSLFTAPYHSLLLSITHHFHCSPLRSITLHCDLITKLPFSAQRFLRPCSLLYITPYSSLSLPNTPLIHMLSARVNQGIFLHLNAVKKSII